MKNRVKGSNRNCWVHNTSKTPIQLKRQAMIAEVSDSDKKVVAVWALREENKEKTQDKTENEKKIPADAKQNETKVNNGKK